MPEKIIPLPKKPPKMWEGGRRGRPSANNPNQLIAFLRDTYGSYLPAHADTLREFIYREDIKLYRAITNYERDRELPNDLKMTTRRARVLSRLQRAMAHGLNDLTPEERPSVVQKLRRDFN